MNNFIWRELAATDFFDPLTLAPLTPFTQAAFYGEWQRALGREVRRFTLLRAGQVVAYCQLVSFPLLGGKSYWYAPYGPVITDWSVDCLRVLKAELGQVAARAGAVFVRLDFTPPALAAEQRKLLRDIFTPAPLYTYHSAQFQPRAEWWLSLAPTEEELLAAAESTTRRAVRSAGTKGITTEIVATDFVKYFPAFWDLLTITSRRNGFNLHPASYYQHIFNHLTADNAYLAVSRYQDKILVITLVIVYGVVATNVFSGSANEHRNLRPTDLNKWAVVTQAKQRGLAYCNFGGIALGQIYRGWEGLTGFKQKFGGQTHPHSDLVDLVVRPAWYYLYNVRKFIKQYFR